METLSKTVKGIAYARDHAKLSALQRSFIPLLSFGSSLYRLLLSLRHLLYHWGFFSKHRLPVPVISVGNLTWGGNGKTPMVEYIAKCLADSGISSLILTRGYAGGDEAKMLQRHLLDKPVKIGVGANRAATAAWFLKMYGYVDYCGKSFERTGFEWKDGTQLSSEKIGAAILDDGMQHWSLCRDLEILMVNGLMPWGNCRLIPFGPLREPLMALRRVDVAVVHHANLVSDHELKDIEIMMSEINESVRIFLTQMAPSCFFDVKNINTKKHLEAVHNAIVLCVSAIASADAFVRQMGKLGAFYVDRLDFSDHHSFRSKDIQMMRLRLRQLEEKYGYKPIVVVTEKDYDRDPEILKDLNPYEVLALCSELQFISHKGCNEEKFRLLLKESVQKCSYMLKTN